SCSGNELAAIMHTITPQAMADGVDQILSNVSGAVKAGYQAGVDIPGIGSKLLDGMQPFFNKLDAARAAVHDGISHLYDVLDITPTDDVQRLLQETIFNVFGPGGLNVLLDGPDPGNAITPADVAFTCGADIDPQGN